MINKKSKLLKISFVIFIITTTMMLYGCQNSKEIKNLEAYYDKENHSFFQQYSLAERNYCFYLVDNSQNQNTTDDNVDNLAKFNEVEVFFPESIDEIDFTYLKLYYNNQIAEGNYNIEKKSDKSITIKFNSCVENFDSISGKLSNTEYLFYTGEYSFEKITLYDGYEKQGYHFTEVYDNNLKDAVESHIILTESVNKMSLVYPKQLMQDKLAIQGKVFSNAERMKYFNTIVLWQNNLYEKNIKRLSFEGIWLVEENNQRYFIIKNLYVFEAPYTIGNINN